MEKYISLLSLLMMMTIISCKKHHTQPKFPPPSWSINNDNGQYPASMTAVIRMPDDIQRFVQKTDQLGAFAGDECRGVGQLVTAGDKKVFFILIHGTTSEKSRISFKYYLSEKKYMYKTDAFLNFTVDGNYGTVDNPIILGLHPVRE